MQAGYVRYDISSSSRFPSTGFNGGSWFESTKFEPSRKPKLFLGPARQAWNQLVNLTGGGGRGRGAAIITSAG